jgi:hypothetical protein
LLSESSLTLATILHALGWLIPSNLIPKDNKSIHPTYALYSPHSQLHEVLLIPSNLIPKDNKSIHPTYALYSPHSQLYEVLLIPSNLISKDKLSSS